MKKMKSCGAQCLFFSVFSVDNDSCDQRPVLALLRISTDQNCASSTIRASLINRGGDSILVLMESGITDDAFHSGRNATPADSWLFVAWWTFWPNLPHRDSVCSSCFAFLYESSGTWLIFQFSFVFIIVHDSLIKYVSILLCRALLRAIKAHFCHMIMRVSYKHDLVSHNFDNNTVS